MAYTTNQLISGAFYTAGVASREFETVSGQQIGDGLQWLNDIIQENVVNDGMIPYETTYSFSTVAGQEKYTIPDLIQIDTLTFFINTVRFGMVPVGRDLYFGSSRANNVKSLPCTYYFEKQLNGGDLYMYFLPSQIFPIELHGTFGMSSVSLGQDLSLTLAQFYTTYLRYALADRICSEYNLTTSPGIVKQLCRYKDMIDNNSNVLDLSSHKTSTLIGNQQGPDVWGYANLYNGFMPY